MRLKFGRDYNDIDWGITEIKRLFNFWIFIEAINGIAYYGAGENQGF
ncbi:hypothetical protein [Shewanella surugensis]|uniref:Uncharacterized protein n=1 Tax=Shewanella surugensis TaxID=212020 RepID=A0ABT0LGT1_9GAMM|nr:hypothetical protein [Shewanella surugensis]MCL1126759.1 hypothetical protein [Shewanella surugensis]